MLLSINSYADLKDYLSVENVLSVLIFLGLCFAGVSARIIIDMEMYKKTAKEINFFNRYILAVILSYVVQLIIAKREYLKGWYSEIIIVFCIFITDILGFLLKNRIKILSTLFVYMVKAFTKGAIDLQNIITKEEPKDKE